jgi:hypothetical protein
LRLLERSVDDPHASASQLLSEDEVAESSRGRRRRIGGRNEKIGSGAGSEESEDLRMKLVVVRAFAADESLALARRKSERQCVQSLHSRPLLRIHGRAGPLRITQV